MFHTVVQQGFKRQRKIYLFCS